MDAESRQARVDRLMGLLMATAADPERFEAQYTDALAALRALAEAGCVDVGPAVRRLRALLAARTVVLVQERTRLLNTLAEVN